MKKESILPKNVRQIGDIRGNIRIYMEDYVMTFIHKKEQQEEKGGFLGVFLGETQRTEEEVRIYIRGLMEVTGEENRKLRMERKQRNDTEEDEWDAGSDEEWRENETKQELSEALAGAGNLLNKRFGRGRKSEEEEKRERSEETGQSESPNHTEKSENPGWSVRFKTRNRQEKQEQTEPEAGTEGAEWKENEGAEAAGRAEHGEQTEPEAKVESEKWTRNETEAEAGKQKRSEAGAGHADWDVKDSLTRTVQEECREYFGAWEILGCCVIGEYPVERMKKLTAEAPQSQMLIYHLQEQEENLYCTENGRYEQISGYFVFYEQNRMMQEYMAEVLRENSTDKDGISDQAIRNFREKIKEKDHIRTGSMLKMASSFFVVTVLVIGAIAVNRIDRIRGVSSSYSETAENEIYQGGSGQSTPESQENRTAVSGSLLPSDAETAAAAVTDLRYQAGTADQQDGTDMTDSQNTAVMTDAQDSGVMTDAQDSGVMTDAQDSGVMTDSQDMAAMTGTQDLTVTAGSQQAAAAGSQTGTADQSAEQSGLTASNEAALAGQTGDTDAAAEAAARQTRASYVVKNGDTLADICQKYYGNLDKLDEICSINEITNANMIMPGDKIVLP